MTKVEVRADPLQAAGAAMTDDRQAGFELQAAASKHRRGSLRHQPAGFKQETVSRVACRIFHERGYHATSMRAIASALGMQPAALYYYYESKETLLFSIMDRAVDALTQQVCDAIQAAAPPRVRLTQAIGAHILAVSDHLDELSVFLNETKALGPELAAEIGAKRDAYEGLFRRILEEGVASGDFGRVDPKLAGFLILSACNWLYHWYKPGGAYRPEEIARTFTDMILHGLTGAQPAARDR